MGLLYKNVMRVISRKTLREFWETHTDVRESLQAWLSDSEHATWQSPADIKNMYRNAGIITNNRVVFNIKGNTYRLVVLIKYESGIVFIRFIGTHEKYDKIDAATV
jgi:mRNA interferase HigB